jgi:hypothetical protein
LDNLGRWKVKLHCDVLRFSLLHLQSCERDDDYPKPRTHARTGNQSSEDGEETPRASGAITVRVDLTITVNWSNNVGKKIKEEEMERSGTISISVRALVFASRPRSFVKR